MVWGNQASVLVGDYLLGQAFRTMVEVGSLDALAVLSRAAAVIAEGEVLQLVAAKHLTTSEEQYLQVINAKTAALFSAGHRGRPDHRRQFGQGARRACRIRHAARPRLPACRRRARLRRLVDDARQEGGRRLPRGQGDAADPDRRHPVVATPIATSGSAPSNAARSRTPTSTTPSNCSEGIRPSPPPSNAPRIYGDKAIARARPCLSRGPYRAGAGRRGTFLRQPRQLIFIKQMRKSGQLFGRTFFLNFNPWSPHRLRAKVAMPVWTSAAAR